MEAAPENHTRSLWRGMEWFALPFEVPEFTISLFWLRAWKPLPPIAVLGLSFAACASNKRIKPAGPWRY